MERLQHQHMAQNSASPSSHKIQRKMSSRPASDLQHAIKSKRCAKNTMHQNLQGENLSKRRKAQSITPTGVLKKRRVDADPSLPQWVGKGRPKRSRQQKTQTAEPYKKCPGEDSRQLYPKNWDEVRCLQIALNPSIYHFTLLTRRIPAMPCHWESYDKQWTDLQRQLRHISGSEQIHLKDSCLFRLDKWIGGISNEAVAMKLRHKAQVDGYHQQQSNMAEPSLGTLLWLERYEVPRLYINEQTNLERASKKGHTALPLRADEESLGPGIAHDPEQFLHFLYTTGFVTFRRNAGQRNWDEWCKYEAPFDFQMALQSDSSPRTRARSINQAITWTEPMHVNLTQENVAYAHNAWIAEGRPATTTSKIRRYFQHVIERDIFITVPQEDGDALRQKSQKTLQD